MPKIVVRHRRIDFIGRVSIFFNCHHVGRLYGIYVK